MRYSRSIDAEIHPDRQSKDALRTWLNLARKCADFNLLPSMTQPDFVLSRFMRNTRRQARSTSLITLSKSSRFASVKFGQITATSSKPNSIGMSKTSASGTPTSNAALLSSTAKSSAHTDPISRNFTNFSATKVTLISSSNSTHGKGFKSSPDRTVPTTGKPLTKLSEARYSNPEIVPQVRPGYNLPSI